MKLTFGDILRLFCERYKELNVKKYRKAHFKIFLCETDCEHDFKTSYKFDEMVVDYNDNNMYLKNRFGWTTKVLNRYDVVWINSITMYDRNLEFELINFNYAKIKEVEE